jgi:hypothetical protein
MDGDGPARGTRDNGLRCASYVAVADLDPRVADALLGELRDNGIAAYAAPAPGATGGYGERRLPDRPVDRLWVDEARAEQARGIVDGETRDHRAEPELDFDQAWQQLLTSLQSTPGGPMPSWPAGEDGGTTTSQVVRPATLDDEPLHDPADDEHFEPPPPPPFPRLRPVTVAAIAAIAIGLLMLATNFDGGSFELVAIAGVVGGVASLVWNMRQGPPTDSGWDDGAVI